MGIFYVQTWRRPSAPSFIHVITLVMMLLVTFIFVAGYLAIASEHALRMSKSAIALAMGGLMWLILAMGSDPLAGYHLREDVLHAGAEIFEIVAFLLAAMSLVEILVHYRFFDTIRAKLLAMGLDDRRQFYLLGILTFFLSAALDNLTTTIVMIQIARRFFSGKALLAAAAGIVILANAGGAWSPVGDVTTIMLWVAGKFSAFEVISQGILPSIALGLVSGTLIGRQIPARRNADKTEEKVPALSSSEKAIIALVFASFTLPIIVNSVFDLPPFIGLLIGLGLVWLGVDFFRRIRPAHDTHLTANIDTLIQKTDIASIKFFIGILLAVAALAASGALNSFSTILYGEIPTTLRIIAGNVGLGVISAILDNVPLAAIALQVLEVTNPAEWVLLALTLGTGGSLLVIGSAAGVVAMGMVKELTFMKYLRIATLPAALGFVVAIIVWYAQSTLLGVI